MHTDGVGSKVSWCLAQERGGDISSCAQDALAMNLNDMATLGCVGPWRYTNTIHVHPSHQYLVPIIRAGFERQDNLWGFECLGGETCITDTIQDVLIDVTMVCLLEKPLWDLDDVSKGDIVYGWSTPSPGSNGFTKIRDYTEFLTFPSLEALQEPTPYFFLSEHNLEGIKALIHCTGGGLFKARRWGINIEYNWKRMQYPQWFHNIIQVTGWHVPDLLEHLNGGYQMIAFGPFALRLGVGWYEIGRVL